MSKIIKNKIPILEFDKSIPAVIEPSKIFKKKNIPEHAVLCFFNEVIGKLIEDGKAKLITTLHTSFGRHPVYEFEFYHQKVTVFHPGLGAPLCAGMLEEIIALGCRKFIACGGAGVLNKEITMGQLIIPVSAVRDEGTSYHYIAPSREICPSPSAVKAIKKTLERRNCKYITGKTWTTDAFYRETPEKVILRKKEGCITVEMEAAAFFAVAKFRRVKFGQLLYGGDDVSCADWDPRTNLSRKEIREKIFEFAVEACLEL